MRLLDHRTGGSSLEGIKQKSGIPECFGLYGVGRSGYFTFPHELSGGVKTSQQDYSVDDMQQIPPSLPLATGGVQVLRPLLRFSKRRLIAACKQRHIEWFEDATNADPSTTRRNAIRHIFKHHNLPVALQKPRLLQLAEHMRQKTEALQSIAKELFDDSHIHRFDSRTGVLVIKPSSIQQLDRVFALDEGARPKDRRIVAQQVAALLVGRIVEVVSPVENVPVSDMHVIANLIFPHLYQQDGEFEQPHQSDKQTAATVAGIYIKRLLSNALPAEDSSQKATGSWILCRQPYAINFEAQIIKDVQPQTPTVWSPWFLYDGRFWIRIRSSRSTRVRPFRHSDMKGFLDLFPQHKRKHIRVLLKVYAAGSIRWTLPVIADHRDTMIALPTFDIIDPRLEPEHIKYEVAYKQVELPQHMSAENVA